MVESNIEMAVNNLHEQCKAKGIDFLCYIADVNTDKQVITVTTNSKNRLIDGVVKCAAKDAGLLGMFKQIFIRLKKPYLWN